MENGGWQEGRRLGSVVTRCSPLGQVTIRMDDCLWTGQLSLPLPRLPWGRLIKYRPARLWIRPRPGTLHVIQRASIKALNGCRNVNNAKSLLLSKTIRTFKLIIKRLPSSFTDLSGTGFQLAVESRVTSSKSVPDSFCRMPQMYWSISRPSRSADLLKTQNSCLCVTNPLIYLHHFSLHISQWLNHSKKTSLWLQVLPATSTVSSIAKQSLLANRATPQASFTVQLQIRVEIKTLQTSSQKYQQWNAA